VASTPLVDDLRPRDAEALGDLSCADKLVNVDSPPHGFLASSIELCVFVHSTTK
jgi:hypothetical protein